MISCSKDPSSRGEVGAVRGSARPVKGERFVCLCVLSAQSCLTLCDSVNRTRQAPLSMEFPRQECWRGVPFPTRGGLPDPGIKPLSLVSLHWPTDSLPLCHGTPQEVSTPSEFREREAIARNS